MNPGQPRGMELRIAEDMTSILDYLSRLMQGINNGDWHYVYDKANELARTAHLPKDAAGYEIEHQQTKPRETARPQAIIATITRDARHHITGRTLYPASNRHLPGPTSADMPLTTARKVKENKHPLP